MVLPTILDDVTLFNPVPYLGRFPKPLHFQTGGQALYMKIFFLIRIQRLCTYGRFEKESWSNSKINYKDRFCTSSRRSGSVSVYYRTAMSVSLTNLAGLETSFCFLICDIELTALFLVPINLNSCSRQ